MDKAAPPHEQLAYYRKPRGLSKDELAGMIGVSAGEIVNYEKQFQEIYGDQAQKLAQALERIKTLRSTVSIWEIELHRPSRQNYQNMFAIKTHQEASA